MKTELAASDCIFAIHHQLRTGQLDPAAQLRAAEALRETALALRIMEEALDERVNLSVRADRLRVAA